MTTSARRAGLVMALCLGAGCKGCDKGGDGARSGIANADGGTGPAGAAAGGPGATSAPIAGTTDPSPRLTRGLAARLDAGYRALRARRVPEARAAFAEVVAAAPDHLPARHQLVLAAAQDGDFDAATREYGELLLRDYPGYAARLDTPAARKELAAWRASAAWPRAEALRAQALAAWTTGYDQGFFHVARTGTPSPGRLRQDAFFYDAAHDRYRRLTGSGKVYAMAVAPDRAALALLLVDEAAAGDATHGGRLMGPRAALLELTTLTVRGPVRLGPDEALVQLGFDAGGHAVWRAGELQYGLDPTGNHLARAPAGPAAFGPGGATLADADTVAHTDTDLGGAVLAPDGLTLTLPGLDKPLRAARPLDAAAITWSPGRARLAYAGVLDACRVLAAAKPGADDANELFVWERERGVASRVATGVSHFEALWLDDDRLAYEGGVGAAGRLHLRAIASREDRVLLHRHGAGLHGLPTLYCEPRPAADPEEPPPAEAAEPE